MIGNLTEGSVCLLRGSRLFRCPLTSESAGDRAILRWIDALRMDFLSAVSWMLRYLLADKSINSGQMHVPTLIEKMVVDVI